MKKVHPNMVGPFDCRQTMKIEFVYSFFACINLDVDWNVGHSLSAGGQGASSAFACGLSPRRAFHAGVSYTRSNQLRYNI
ncbi:hypothetical protein ABH916_002376 [Peribacillus frigoritolerans]